MQLWQSKPIQAIQVTPSGMETDEKLKNITIHDSSKPPSSQHSHRGFLFAEGFNSRDLTHFLMFPTHRIHGAAIPLVTWIPSTKTPFLLAYTSTMDPSWVMASIMAPWLHSSTASQKTRSRIPAALAEARRARAWRARVQTVLPTWRWSGRLRIQRQNEHVQRMQEKTA